jgi:hypothetical protein
MKKFSQQSLVQSHDLKPSTTLYFKHLLLLAAKMPLSFSFTVNILYFLLAICNKLGFFPVSFRFWDLKGANSIYPQAVPGADLSSVPSTS